MDECIWKVCVKRVLKECLAVAICFLTIIFFQSRLAFASDFEKEIESLFSLPEEKIDIGITALTLAKEIYPEIDIDVYSALIDYEVGRARTMTNGCTDPDYRIRVLNTLLFQIIGIKYDLADPEGENFKNRTLNGLLDRRKGNCASMPILYIAIAQRLGYPVYAVPVPDHLFVRYVDSNLNEQNIEASGGGGYISDEDYIKELQISEKGIKSGAYLRPLTRKELLARQVTENAIYWGQHGDIKRAIKYLELSLNASPSSPEINDRLGRAYLLYSKSLEGEEAKEYVTKGNFYKSKAIDLGLVMPPQSSDFLMDNNDKPESLGLKATTFKQR